MDNGYYNRPYDISSKLRQMMEAKLGKNLDLTFIQIEKILSSLKDDEYTTPSVTLNDNDKTKLMTYIKDMSPNRQDKLLLDNLSNFLTDKFTKEEVKSLSEYYITKYYKPGEVYSGARISNRGVLYFLDKVKSVTLKNGILINKKYVNDLMNFFNREDFSYDKETLMVQEDLTQEMIDLFNKLNIEKSDYYTNDEIFIIKVSNYKKTPQLKKAFKGLEIQKILDFSYYDKKEELIDETESGATLENIGGGIGMIKGKNGQGLSFDDLKK